MSSSGELAQCCVELCFQNLKKYIPVDIYGKCGEMSCGEKLNYADCDSNLLSKNYKFYLSFENSICQDYVTEKLWRIIANKNANVIPVVLGGANYSAFLPDKTYVDATKFDSPHQLSTYLWKIANDDNLYNEYIRNKLAIEAKPVPMRYGSKSPTYASRLCQYLHDTKGKVTQVGKGGDARQYWSKEEKCWSIRQYCKNCSFLTE